jgi:RHH-type proline utilization regulon transcriptional repressor/proline dehydrogenase/delta 1-pyrroline-5-carboxylate dehydrogenase
MGKSAFGPGIKAGGPNYVIPLMQFSDAAPASGRGPLAIRTDSVSVDAHPRPAAGAALTAERYRRLRVLHDGLASSAATSIFTEEVVAQVESAIDSYLHWSEVEFSQAHDHFRLVGEDNFRRYLPVTPMRIRVHAEDTAFEVFARAAASAAAGCRTIVSTPPTLDGPARDAVALLDQLTDPWAAAIEFIEETDDELAEEMQEGGVRRIRYAHHARAPEIIRRASAESYVYLADAPVLAEGRVELLWYLQEQSLSHVYHRYGNLGRRAEEPRAAVM